MHSVIWQVQIGGWNADLVHLARHFKTSPFRVFKDDRADGYLYESDAFLTCQTADSVLAVTAEELQSLSGVMKYSRHSPQPLRAIAVYQANGYGNRSAFVKIHGVQAVVQAGELSTVVVDRTGDIVDQKPTPLPRSIGLSKLIFNDAPVAKVMRLLAAPEAQSWVGMYRIYEVIEAEAGGAEKLKKRNWVSRIDLKRFKHSANSVSVGGDAARHGTEYGTPPNDPMRVEEASAYLDCLIDSWLAEKEARRGVR